MRRFGWSANASGAGCANALRKIQRDEPNAAGGCVDEAGLPGRDVRALGQSKASRTPETEGDSGRLRETNGKPRQTEGDSGRLERDLWEVSAGHAKVSNGKVGGAGRQLSYQRMGSAHASSNVRAEGMGT